MDRGARAPRVLMISRKASSIAALAVLLAAVGCGGSGKSIHLLSGNVNFTGVNTISDTLTEPATVPATGGTTITTSAGATVIPSGVAEASYPADTPLAILPVGMGFKLNSITSNSLSVNGVSNSGIGLNANGKTSVAVALPVSEAGTPYTLSFSGASLDTRDLTVGTISFTGKFYFRNETIVSPIPVSIIGQIPNDGENAGGSTVTTNYGPGNDGRTATLDVVYGNGFELHQTQVISEGKAVFKNLFIDATPVPDSGVQSVSFTIGDL